MKHPVLGATAALMLCAVDTAHAETIGQWQFEAKTDPITGSGYAVAAVFQDGNSFGLRCDKQGPGSVYPVFLTRDFFGTGRANGDRTFTYRFDQDPPQTDGDWRYGDQVALLARDADRFNRRLAAATKLAVRGVTYRLTQITQVFDVTGAREVVAKVYAACGDTYSE